MSSFSPEQQHQIGIALGKLIDRLTRAKEELSRLQKQEGAGYGRRLPRMVKLAEEIKSLIVRIERAENLLS